MAKKPEPVITPEMAAECDAKAAEVAAKAFEPMTAASPKPKKASK